MASSPITSLQIDGKKMETMKDFIFLGSKITEDGDCGIEMKRGLLLGRKVMANLDSILKSTDRPLPTKVHKSDAEDSREFLGLQWDQTSQSWRKSVLNIHWKDWCWSWNSNTLTTWCKELTHWKRFWCWERSRTGGDVMRWLDGIIDLMLMSLSELWEKGKDREAWHALFHGVAKSLTWLRDWKLTGWSESWQEI